MIKIFVLTSRARRYIDGVGLPLTVADISSVMAIYPCRLPRWLVDEIVFEMDRLELDEMNKKK
ncbi:hypothetical protein AAX06_01430 [Moraxella bovoculi]|uniref:Uncharacterized protein n=1 Tax=Moraxella bovoculi TaxID=386891 RepID=A0AAC8PX92_9GAMM|nr:hypothetical protein [Moraxella bovoculi]AKG08668.1 hypothetical protein AAX06_01430 [Moraxella bovoculi]